MVVVREQEWECDFDWKVMVENFAETYHHLGAHHSTLQPLMPAKRNWTEQERRRYLHSHLPFTDRYAATIQSALDTSDTTATFPILPGLSEAGMTHWHILIGYPLFLLLTAPDSWAWYRVHPIAPGKARLTTHLLVPASTRDRPDFPDLLEREYAKLVSFHLEDMEVCAAVQRGLQSRTSQPGPLSHLEMPVWLFHRYLAARTRQTWPTDDRPAAPSQTPTA
jgi:phenylpropionate dioxygenase-like ring-hydroxylating dioxygenase large terminal subunit